MKKTLIGKLAEQQAVNYLQTHQISLVEQNFYSRFGEIDIIGLDKNDPEQPYLVFFEVRSRKPGRFGNAMESITSSKQYKIRKTAEYFILKHPSWQNYPMRFDVVVMSTEQLSDTQACHWLKNAF